MGFAPKHVPETLDSDRAIQVWAADRNRCVCKRPVEGPVHLNVKHCRICRLPMRTQRRSS
jgi:hypothetical protein